MKIVCLKWGDKFSHEHVNRLYKMVCKNYKDDFNFFKHIIEYFDGNKFGLRDILSYIDDNPEVSKINYYLEQNWSENQNNNIKLILKDEK